MTAATLPRRLALASGDLVNLDDARGTTVRVGRGQVWLTQYGDPVDHVLDAGDSWAIERNGRTIVQAQHATILDLSGPGAAAAIIPVASAPTPGQLSGWLARAADGWMNRRWAPYV
jgi:hypothetical protein